MAPQYVKPYVKRHKKESMQKCGILGSLSGNRRLRVVGGHGRVPLDEGLPECAVEGPGLQEPVGTELRPLHLLLLGEGHCHGNLAGAQKP
jgi:hypothetical protein